MTGLPALELADSNQLKQGQVVFAFGSPLGLENSVTMGVVSSTARQIDPDNPSIYIQTDAPINPGNSGGPLVDVDGRMVGINTFILTQSGGNEGLGFAIPSDVVRNIYDQIRTEGHVHRGQIGVFVRTITPELVEGLHLPARHGVLLEDVAPGSPADKAGLKAGEVVTSVGGKPVDNVRQFALDLYSYKIGQKAEIGVLRNGKETTLSVPVIERPDDPMRFADLVSWPGQRGESPWRGGRQHHRRAEGFAWWRHADSRWSAGRGEDPDQHFAGRRSATGRRYPCGERNSHPEPCGIEAAVAPGQARTTDRPAN